MHNSATACLEGKDINEGVALPFSDASWQYYTNDRIVHAVHDNSARGAYTTGREGCTFPACLRLLKCLSISFHEEKETGRMDSVYSLLDVLIVLLHEWNRTANSITNSKGNAMQTATNEYTSLNGIRRKLESVCNSCFRLSTELSGIRDLYPLSRLKGTYGRAHE